MRRRTKDRRSTGWEKWTKITILAAFIEVWLFIGGMTAVSAALKNANSCSDSDGGTNINIFGTTSGYLDNKAYSHSDACVDNGTVKEYYCSGTAEGNVQTSCGTDGYGANYCLNGDVYKNYMDYYCAAGACGSNSNPILQQDCLYGCMNGACIKQQADSCNDSDGGNMISVFGTVSGFVYGGPYSLGDGCIDAGTINEYYCNATHSARLQQSCGTDGYVGGNYCMNGSVFRDFRDYYCGTGACSSATAAVLQQACTSGCVNGSCIATSSCSDSDGGINYLTYGYAHISGSNNTYYDWCYRSNLTEYYCSGNTLTHITYACPYGCSNGACVQAPVNSCNDTDGGYAFNVRGTVMGNSNNTPYSYSDTCVNNWTLSEWFCSGTMPYNIANYTCSLGNFTACMAGRCI